MVVISSPSSPASARPSAATTASAASSGSAERWGWPVCWVSSVMHPVSRKPDDAFTPGHMCPCNGRRGRRRMQQPGAPLRQPRYKGCDDRGAHERRRADQQVQRWM